MWKTLIIVVAVILGVVAIAFGWDRTWSYMKGTQQVITEEVDNRTPIRLEAARIAALIEKENESILAYEDRVCDLEARRDSTARAFEEARKRLQAETDLLKRVKSLLEQKQEQYRIGRNTYSYAEVNADALERLEAVKRIQESVTFNETLIYDLDQAIGQGRGSLADARKRLAELNSAMARLEARNTNADVRLELAKLTNSANAAPFSANSELEKAFRNYERRVAQKERQASARLANGSGQFRIDYSAAMVTQDAAAEIDRVLSAGSEPKAPPLQTQPSAVEALDRIAK